MAVPHWTHDCLVLFPSRFASPSLLRRCRLLGPGVGGCWRRRQVFALRLRLLPRNGKRPPRLSGISLYFHPCPINHPRRLLIIHNFLCLDRGVCDDDDDDDDGRAAPGSGPSDWPDGSYSGPSLASEQTRPTPIPSASSPSPAALTPSFAPPLAFDLSLCTNTSVPLVRMLTALHPDVVEHVPLSRFRSELLPGQPLCIWTDRKATLQHNLYVRMPLDGSVRTNHFAGMVDYTSKSVLARRLDRMRALFPASYDFYPRSWVLPSQSNSFRKAFEDAYLATRKGGPLSGAASAAAAGVGADAAAAGVAGAGTVVAAAGANQSAGLAALWSSLSANGQVVYIVKPNVGSKGDSIRLACDYDGVLRASSAIRQEQSVTRSQAKLNAAVESGVTVQRYLSRPLLLDGHKFDFRVYVLVQSLDPLTAYVYREGLARFATERYVAPSADNLDKTHMHLTNYSLNRDSSAFVEEDYSSTAFSERGSKRAISTVLRQIRESGMPLSDRAFWSQVDAVVRKTLVAIWSPMFGSFKSCFPAWPSRSPAAGAGSATGAGASGVATGSVAATAFTSAATKSSDGSGAPSACGTPAPEPALLPSKSPCFNMLGFDLMLDAQCRLWLIEINAQPSLHIESAYDLAVKVGFSHIRSHQSLFHAPLFSPPFILSNSVSPYARFALARLHREVAAGAGHPQAAARGVPQRRRRSR